LIVLGTIAFLYFARPVVLPGGFTMGTPMRHSQPLAACGLWKWSSPKN
jgi:hypothetical protein